MFKNIDKAAKGQTLAPTPTGRIMKLLPFPPKGQMGSRVESSGRPIELPEKSGSTQENIEAQRRRKGIRK